MKRALAAVTLALVPGAARPALGPLYGGEVTVALPSVPGSLGPGAPADSAERLLTGLVHETLVHLGHDGELRPGLAVSWSEAASGREWHLALDPRVLAHDGHRLTADDAARALRRYVSAGSPAGRRLGEALDGGPSGIAAPDPGHLVLRFTAPTAAALAPLASPSAAVVSPAGAGAGPFVPGSAPGRSLRLAPFSAHVRGRPFLDGVRLLAVPEDWAREAALRARQVQIASGGSGLSAPAALLLLLLEPSHSPLDERRVRAAVAKSIPRADLVAHFVPGGAATARILFGAAAVQDPLPFPRPLARASIPLAVAADVPPRVSQRVVAYLDAMGIEARASTHSASAARARRGPRLILFVPEVPEPELALRELAALVPSAPAAQHALGRAMHEMDPARRHGLLEEAESALLDTHVPVPLAIVPVAFQADPRVHGAHVDGAGRLTLEDAWLEP